MSFFRPNPHGQNLYVIPDVHGCSGQLLNILKRITPLKKNDLIFFLGDFCDRGNDSPGVLDICIKLHKKYNNKADKQIYFIRGNHDQLLLSICGRDYIGFDPNLPSAYSIFINNGGDLTIQQYFARKGVEIKKPKELTIDRAISCIETAHLDFLQKETQTVAQIDKYIFCHAGYEVDKLIDEQDNNILMWDRSLYQTVKSIAAQGKSLHWADKMTIVTGHNYDGVFFTPGYIMCDASMYNKLIVIELNSMTAFSSSPGHDRLVKYHLKES